MIGSSERHVKVSALSLQVNSYPDLTLSCGRSGYDITQQAQGGANCSIQGTGCSNVVGLTTLSKRESLSTSLIKADSKFH